MSSQRKSLSKKEIKAMREFRATSETEYWGGRKRIVSMQGLEEAGLVRRVIVNGKIDNWELTEEGRAWEG